MEAIILAGGRGRRLGALTKKKQKAALCFCGTPLIVHVINDLLTQEIGRINILTGYRGKDVWQICVNYYSDQLDSGNIRILDFPYIWGTLNRLMVAIPYLDESFNGYYVCGIDSLIPFSVSKRFLRFTRFYQQQLILLLSPNIKKAPTHWRVRLIDNRIISYNYFTDYSGDKGAFANLYADVGVRYFPYRLISELREMNYKGERNIPDFIFQKFQSGDSIIGFPFSEDWKHVANPSDFQAV
ncbi:MAG: hypothetical protein A2729_01410 [Candidatus Buchananbacteria bacterium RIFCSPHIGHO2_01_FULL_39_14]|uniref:MobA-like NTP transferase domain-containing protein n=2 Tax=Candidatus Buchananiibacteriota TaxID=1817903 RepID=A0A1G1YT20_9BACT|nr:MAG: hypothetical protein A2729_01410 [Candidatus Buchananbacteria bacterium RIFCSPHIGHO2_01_FULL_39_14]OGY55419.1 MAG: hypothetical protein A2912_00760 [Candidatus Buchananbacteria bacterium RIFCSPLOWO2_01_FULL_40_23b]